MSEPQITYLKGWSRMKDSAFSSITDAVGGGVALSQIGLSFRDFPESRNRATDALAVAKRQPRSRLMKFLKFHLIRAQYNWSRRYFSKHSGTCAMCWNGVTGSRRVFMEGARDAGCATLYAELAPFPDRLQLDPRGVNASGSVPRDPAFYTSWAAKDSSRTNDDWRAMGEGLVARKSRRADVGQDARAEGFGGPFLFVPLQVPNDSQITMFSGWVGSVEGFLDALAVAAASLPEGWHVRVKEHPSAKTSLADPLAAAVSRSEGRIIVDNATDTFAQVAASSGVVTINSSVGLQAFFHDKPVIVTGEALFGIEGLVERVTDQDDLAACFARAGELSFDASLRAAFMTYLMERHFIKTTRDAEGNLTLDAEAVRAKFAQAKAIDHTMK